MPDKKSWTQEIDNEYALSQPGLRWVSWKTIDVLIMLLSIEGSSASAREGFSAVELQSSHPWLLISTEKVINMIYF